MTVDEARSMFSERKTAVSVGYSLNQLCYFLYGKITPELTNALVVVNKNYDFINYAPGTEVHWFEESIMEQIS